MVTIKYPSGIPGGTIKMILVEPHRVTIIWADGTKHKYYFNAILSQGVNDDSQ